MDLYRKKIFTFFVAFSLLQFGFDSHCQAEVKAASNPSIGQQWAERADGGDNNGKQLLRSVSTSLGCRQLAGFIQEFCMKSLECRNITEANCSRITNTCECNHLTHVPSSNNDKLCRTFVNYLNTNCNQTSPNPNAECIAVSATFFSKQCFCSVGFIQSERLPYTCVKVADFRGKCSEDAQCREIGLNSTLKCIMGHCQCPVTYPPSVFYKGQCVAPRKLGEICEGDDQCHVGISEYSHCFGVNGESRCRCLWGTLKRYDSCWRAKRVGDYCMEDLECSVAISGRVRCNSTGRCVCNFGACPVSDGTICHDGDANSGNIFDAMGSRFTFVVSAVVNMMCVFVLLFTSCDVYEFR